MQQYLPFTVLKLSLVVEFLQQLILLQQYLPFTVLKPSATGLPFLTNDLIVATVLTVYGIETTFKFATVLTVYAIETCKVRIEDG